MIPDRFRIDCDPEPDDELEDARRDARHEEPAPPAPDFSDEEWAGIRGSDFDDGALTRPRVSVDAGEGGRHRAAGNAR